MIGDIVILPFPYADSPDAKDRPTVLLADVGDGRYSDWIVLSGNHEPDTLPPGDTPQRG